MPRPRPIVWFALAWAAYIVSMALPVLDPLGDVFPGLWGWQAWLRSYRALAGPLLEPETSYSWWDLEAFLYFWPNTVMLLSPLIVACRPAWAAKRWILLPSAAALIIATLPLRSADELRSGYWVWLISMVALVMGIWALRGQTASRSPG